MSLPIIELIIHIAITSLTTFFAILLWPKTHEIAWMLIIIGLVINYVSVIYGALETFGLSRLDTNIAWLDLVITVLLKNLPYLCLSAGLWLAYRQKTDKY